MNESLLVISAIAACVCVVLIGVVVTRISRIKSAPRIEEIGDVLRREADRFRQIEEDGARSLRMEVTEGLRGHQDSTIKAFKELGETITSGVRESTNRIDIGMKAIEDRSAMTGAALDQGIERINNQAMQEREVLRRSIEVRLDDSASKHASAAKDLRDELGGAFVRLGSNISESLNAADARQREGLKDVGIALNAFTERQEKVHESLRALIEQQFGSIRAENADKLEEMRRTVDERLQSTLEARLGESFNRVVEQLERVHKGIGEMQTLANGVGDLKKVLSNVRTRGAFGEVQLDTLLEQFLTPEQYARNVQVRENTQERVEFAIRLPGREDAEVLLPVDAKFPLDDYERLLDALQAGDVDRVKAATDSLQSSVRSFAKMISEKYIAPPKTTDFAILFLPTESLYAEVLRTPGLLDGLQRQFHVTLAGPTTLSALLNGLQMGFRSLAIERRSSEVWQILGAVRSEFGKYSAVVTRLARQLDTASKSVEALGVRTRAMDRRLGSVETLPSGEAPLLMGVDQAIAEDPQDEPELMAAD